MDQANPESQVDLREVMNFLRRRWKMMVSIGVVFFAVVAAVAVLLPPVYRSVATILIEEQEIPQDLVRTTISSYADERIHVISQQVMTRANLIQIIDKYDLYAQKRKRETSEEILDRLRKDIHMDLVNADVIDRRSGSRMSATIAFTLAYDGDRADKAQKVANELVSLYLNENLKNRQQHAADTSAFLTQEAERVSAQITELEEKLAAFKKKNVSRLPELSQLNLQLRDRTDAEITDTERQMLSLDERKFYLDGQLAQIKPNTPVIGPSGERVPDIGERLRGLRTQYAALQGIYSPEHPDVKRMQGEIASLERELNVEEKDDDADKELVKLRGEVAQLSERYGPAHPDIVSRQSRIAALEKLDASRPPKHVESSRKPENPTYITFQAQVNGLISERRALERKRQELVAKRTDYEARLMQTPQVEREYLDLSRDRENQIIRYRELKAKVMEAQVAQEMEKGAKGERFSLIDPPQLPEKPRSPDRQLIMFAGFVFAVVSGAGVAGALESVDGSVNGPRQLMRTLSVPVLSVIPYMERREDRRRRLRRRWLIFAGLVLAAVAGLAVIHFYFMPLEVLWFSLLRRLHLD
jgi:uncharacterized protein involved in exopolysaccharide biosynthesis